MTVALIAAVGKNNELGKDNNLIWRFKEDMQFFKRTTSGGTVIMGRKTFESLPKALPDRKNIVITSNRQYTAPGAQTVHSLEEALQAAGDGETFIIGGARVYREALPLCDKLYLTEIEDECRDADVYFPPFNKAEFTAQKLAEYVVDGIRFSHMLYTKTGDRK